MISLTTLLASATVAAAAKKVEDVPAPGIVDTILGFVPSWLGGPVAQVFDKGVETLGCVLGWFTAGPQVVADVVDARHGSWPEVRRSEGVSARRRRRAPRGPSRPRRGARRIPPSTTSLLPLPGARSRCAL